MPGGKTSGCKVGVKACPGARGCCLGGGGGGTILGLSIVAAVLASASDEVPSERLLADFSCIAIGGGGGREAGTYMREIRCPISQNDLS
jgi:hypothetical protein